MAQEQLNDKPTPPTEQTQSSDPRLEKILEALIRLAGQDFQTSLEVSHNRDEVDAISLSVNMLGEELQTFTEEIEKSREQLIQNAKLASLGEMASGLSHELNNPLFLLMGFNDLVIDILQSSYPEAYAEVQEHLEEITRGGERIRKIINHMREFSRQSRNELELVDLNEIIQRSFTLLNEQLNLKQIKTQLYLSETPLRVMVDKIKMEQVFVNLITNARDAIETKTTPTGGQITITSAMDDGFAHVTFADDGCGMDEETQNKMFDAFFTTKEIGKGTGLGMSVSFGILQSFKAIIDCDSAPGKGTVFHIQIPMAENPQGEVI